MSTAPAGDRPIEPIRPIQRVGFVGLGDIGEAMARRLCGGAYELRVHDLRREAVAKLVEAGALAVSGLPELAAQSDWIGVCVVDDLGCEAVVAGPQGLLAAAAPGSVIALHSTIHPETARRLGERAAERGVELLDAPMTGGRAGAEAGRLRYMVGGPAATLERGRPVLATSGDEIIHCGALGAGATAKLCNNLVQYQAFQAYAEAFSLAEAAGVEAETLSQVLGWILNDNARAFVAARAALRADPANTFLQGRLGAARALAAKDLDLALALARELDRSLPAGALCRERSEWLFGLAEGPAK